MEIYIIGFTSKDKGFDFLPLIDSRIIFLSPKGWSCILIGATDLKFPPRARCPAAIRGNHNGYPG